MSIDAVIERIEALLERIAVALEKTDVQPVVNIPSVWTDPVQPPPPLQPTTMTITQPDGFVIQGQGQPVDAPKAEEPPAAPPKRRGRPPKAATSGVSAIEPTPPSVSVSDPVLPAVSPVIYEARVYTEGDVRNALVALQTVTGSREKSMEILGKHTVPPGGTTLSKLPADNFAAVIRACSEAAAA